MDQLLDAIKKLTDEASDFAELQAVMVAEFGNLPSEELAKLMAAAFALAELKGMADVLDGQ